VKKQKKNGRRGGTGKRNPLQEKVDRGKEDERSLENHIQKRQNKMGGLPKTEMKG